MKTIFTAAFAGLLLSLAGAPAFADTADIRASNKAVELDVGGSYVKYGESVNRATFDTETGWMPSLSLGWTWLMPEKASWAPFDNLYLHVEGQAVFGDTHYNGGLQNIFTGAVTPYQSTTHDNIYHVTTRVGRFFTLYDGVTITPYLDLGFRSWRRQLTGIGAYSELYQHGEGLGGVLLQVSPVQNLVLSFSGDAGSTFGAEMSTQGSTFNLGSQPVWQIEGKIGYAITPSFELTTSARLDGFGYAKSGVIRGAYEPDSYTHQMTVMGGLAYHLK